MKGLKCLAVMAGILWMGGVLRAEDGGKWSETVNGLKGRITLERGEVVNGVALISVRMWLSNELDVANAMKVPWSKAKVSWRVVDGAGKDVAKGPVFYDGMGAPAVDLVLPFKGELSFDVTGHGAGIGGSGAMIDLGASDVFVAPDDGKDYFLEGTVEMEQVGHLRAWESWYGKLELPEVRVPVRGEVKAAAEVEKEIEEWGPKLLEKNSRVSEEAFRKMSLVEDAGVVKWYVKALAKNDYGSKFAAIDGLGRFDTEEAREGLAVALKTEGKDIGNTTTAKLAEESAGQIRYSATLMVAKHAEKKGGEWTKMLFSMAHDPYYAVRLGVVQQASLIGGAEARAIVKAGTTDENEEVRGEAVRLLAGMK